MLILHTDHVRKFVYILYGVIMVRSQFRRVSYRESLLECNLFKDIPRKPEDQYVGREG